MMFATHYHSLTKDFEPEGEASCCRVDAPEGVQLGHMSCYPETTEEGTVSITFLYKLAKGSKDKSYGLNVARLARLPAGVIERAKQKSEEFEHKLFLVDHAQEEDAWLAKVDAARGDNARLKELQVEVGAYLKV